VDYNKMADRRKVHKWRAEPNGTRNEHHTTDSQVVHIMQQCIPESFDRETVSKAAKRYEAKEAIGPGFPQTRRNNPIIEKKSNRIKTTNHSSCS